MSNYEVRGKKAEDGEEHRILRPCSGQASSKERRSRKRVPAFAGMTMLKISAAFAISAVKGLMLKEVIFAWLSIQNLCILKGFGNLRKRYQTSKGWLSI